MRFITSLLVLSFTLSNLAHAEDKAPPSAAEELVNLIDLEGTMRDSTSTAFKPYLDQLKQQGYAEETVKKIEVASQNYFDQIATDPDLHREIVGLYSKNFTEAELRELIHFYQTPLGQKTLKCLPSLMQDSMNLGQKYALKYAENYKAEVQKIMEADKEAK
ncbi:hypothetical protein Rhal01_01194 [Rubritalea halochordaticola]|uniref:DUF2059 domain-containing protein n=1 Tax=Rubritalea halochordaticola TaxID=714537 RepID=A0ABP9UZA6_9BACT